MVEDILDANTPLHVSVEHLPNEIQAVLAHDVRHAQVVIHNLIDTIERILFVHDRVQEDPQRPDILLFAAVRKPSKDFGCRVV